MLRPAAIWSTCLTLLVAAPLARGAEPIAAQPAAAPRFETEVAAILAVRCQRCHGSEKPKGGLDLTSAKSLSRGGESGPAVVPGKVDESLLVEMIRDGQMPPEGEAALTAAEIDLINRWVAGGAAADVPLEPLAAAARIDPAARAFWSFRPLARPALAPAVVSSGSLPATVQRTPIDAFVLARLAEHKLTFSPEADRATLLRRVSLDLTGLSPTPQELAEFVADPRADAYERVVDRLLASPHFGQRWGRHWLDAAGYSDITGGDNDAGIIKLMDGKWKYRDYVVRAFNEDKPYERFLLEQLAGDELVDWRNAASFTPETEELLIATGFLRSAADDTEERELRTPDIIHGVLQRTGEVVVGNLLGLTMACAKCHDHKYEPIPQRDYYALLAAFAPAFNPTAWLPPGKRALADVPPKVRADRERHNAELDRQDAELAGRDKTLRSATRQRLIDERLATVPAEIRADVKRALAVEAKSRSEVQKYLAEKFATTCAVSDQQVEQALAPADRQTLTEIAARRKELSAARLTWGNIQAAYDVGPPPITRVLRRGNHDTPGPPVEPGFFSVLRTSEARSTIDSTDPAAQPIGETSGRRLALAHWLTDWQSPAGGLAARVYVNRVWQHLFGRGIVATSENLGQSGARPTHVELLEWLTCQFVDDGRRLKPLVKQIVMSSVYRQSSAVNTSEGRAGQAAAISTDPGNQLLWRMPLKRLEAELVRDALLSVGGQLDPRLGGPPLPVETRADGSVVIDEKNLPSPAAKARRSLYVLARRNYHLSMLNVFDQPAMSTNCPQRQQSAVVLQSLAMLNDDFVREQASQFARRVRSAGESDAAAQIELAFRIALGRMPSPHEAAWSQDLLARQAAELAATSLSAEAVAEQSLAHLCHMLLNTNEFLYIP
jgi:mono/diheme cytochrome c family protein